MENDRTFLVQLTKALYSMFGKEIEDSSQNTKSPFVIKEFKQEERLCTEIVYAPLVKDAHNQWMTEITIKEGEESFRRNLEAGIVKANLFHVVNTDKFEIKRSWVLDQDATFEGRDGVVTKGTWLVETYYSDDTLWEMKKSRKLGGLSLGGYGSSDTITGEITNLRFNKDEYLEIINKQNVGGN